MGMGKLEAAERIFEAVSDEVFRGVNLSHVALFRADDARRKERLEPLVSQVRAWNFWQQGDPSAEFVLPIGCEIAMSFVQVGWLAEARGLIAFLREQFDSLERWNLGSVEPFLYLAEGELALAENRTDDAIDLLERGLESRRNGSSHWMFFLGAESLARAWEKKGSLPRARRVLQDAAQQKHLTLVPTGRIFWLPVQAPGTQEQRG